MGERTPTGFKTGLLAALSLTSPNTNLSVGPNQRWLLCIVLHAQTLPTILNLPAVCLIRDWYDDPER